MSKKLSELQVAAIEYLAVPKRGDPLVSFVAT